MPASNRKTRALADAIVTQGGNDLASVKKRVRDRVARLLCKEQEESIRFLVYLRDNANVGWSERARAAESLLSRGETPMKNASYLGAAGPGGELTDEAPKLFVIGKHKEPQREPKESA